MLLPRLTGSGEILFQKLNCSVKGRVLGEQCSIAGAASQSLRSNHWSSYSKVPLDICFISPQSCVHKCILKLLWSWWCWRLDRGSVGFKAENDNSLGLHSWCFPHCPLKVSWQGIQTSYVPAFLCRGHLSMSDVALLVVDECHHTVGNHSYARIMEQHYHRVAKK